MPKTPQYTDAEKLQYFQGMYDAMDLAITLVRRTLADQGVKSGDPIPEPWRTTLESMGMHRYSYACQTRLYAPGYGDREARATGHALVELLKALDEQDVARKTEIREAP